MGAFLDKPKTEKHSAHGDGNGLRYGLSSMQGWRVEMEDAHTAVVGLPHGLTDWSFFAVYDGHAGSRVANYCSGHLLDHILGQGSAEFASGEVGSVEGVKDGIRSGFLKIDEYMRSFSDLRQGLDRSGSTAVGVLLSPSHLYFINCGDSRAVLCRDGRVGFSTQDHKPCNPREKERIQNAGGSVMIQRVNGSLAVSRALGDYDYKCVDGKGPTEQLVSPEPEVCVMERAAEGDEFVVLACDGIWDVMSNEELCDFVRSRLQVCDELEKVCNAVVDTCLHKGSRDNMSVVLVCLPGAPKVSEEAVRKEEELDKFIETRVEELLQSGGDEGVPDLVTVVRSIATENIPNLPPGGGLASKRSVIEAVYHKLNPHREEEGGVGENSAGAQSKEKGSTRAVLLEALRQIQVGQAGQDARSPLAYALATMARRSGGGGSDPAGDADEDDEEEEGTPFVDAEENHSCQSPVCCSEDHREEQPAASPPPPPSLPSPTSSFPSTATAAEPEPPKPSRDAPTTTTTTAAADLLDQPGPSA